MTEAAAARAEDISSVRMLFHYTTLSGIQGIITNKVLWASDVEFLNDAQELQFGRVELHRALLDKAALLDAPSDPYGAQQSRATAIRSAASHLVPDELFAHRTDYFSVCAACFCEEGDLLSQWRGYGTNGGFSLGFDREALARAQAATTYGPPELTPVRYGPPAISAMVEAAVEAVAPHPTGHPGTTGYHEAARVLLPALAQIKHTSFAEEREWRLLAITDNMASLSFRSGPAWPVPYLDCTYPVEALRVIVIGPGPNDSLREKGVRKLLAASGLRDVEIDHSAAPFRG